MEAAAQQSSLAPSAADILRPTDLLAEPPGPAPPAIDMVLADEHHLLESPALASRRDSVEHADPASCQSPNAAASPSSKDKRSSWSAAKATHAAATATTALAAKSQPAGAPASSANGIIARAFGDGTTDPFGMASGKRRRKKLSDGATAAASPSLLSDYEPGQPLPGMLIAVMSLIDTDGTYALSEDEWLKGNAALELQTSPKEFRLLRESLGKGAAEDELNFSKAMGIYGSRKPVEGYLEDVLRRLMKAIISLTAKVSTIQGVLDQTVLLQENERKAKIGKILRYWKHRHTSTAFDGWRDVAKGAAKLRGRALRHWRLGLATSAWRRWVEMVEGVRAQRDAVAAAVGRWRNRLVGAAFAEWHEAVASVVDERMGKLSRAAARMQNRSLAAAFDEWAAGWAHSSSVREMQRRALVRLSHRLTSAVFWAWAEWVAEDLDRRDRLLRRVGARLAKRCVVSCFEAWHGVALERRSGREAQYTKAIGRLRNRQAQMVFEVWCSFVAWRRRVFERAAFAIGPGRSMWQAWRTWVAAAKEAKQAEQRQWVLDAGRHQGVAQRRRARGAALAASRHVGHPGVDRRTAPHHRRDAVGAPARRRRPHRAARRAGAGGGARGGRRGAAHPAASLAADSRRSRRSAPASSRSCRPSNRRAADGTRRPTALSAR